MSKKLTLGLFGFGVVGQGLYDIIKTKKLNLEIKRFAIKNPDKKRTLPLDLFTTNADDILDDPEINTIVELIDDAEAAFNIVSKALKTGKNVVSANKKMIANHLQELVDLQHEYGTSLLYEGAVCGSIPIIRNLEEYYDNELLHSVSGIFNGSSNYILSKIFNEYIDYDTALKQAQHLGFAETDPTLDVGGFDAKFKLAIVASHAYGLYVKPEEILNIGIDKLNDYDVRFAREKNYKIKLIPTAKEIGNEKVILYVIPKFVTAKSILYAVENEYNGVVVQAAFADQQFFYGKGAGGHPTGSAVLSDIAALRYDYRYEYKKHIAATQLIHSNDHNITVYLRYNNEGLVEKLNFLKVSERYYARDFKYIIGDINLESLIEYKDILNADNSFVVEIA
ncbi:homoserine dehydrogenase [Olivibacter sp. SDN3]|uniref:homoserine dehydrogenase n=1 Tax=Olivibacter sp. SDN3 TaxID=2764720 RepID=UPI001650D539|nr:homoserine dehydrogenase [Olivibacter sp. SDN3]QNL48598.1 homoserine dehydrogenase [Olivibacter sp. SDN3]